MAKRPIFIPRTNGIVGVETKYLEFDWFPGFSASQKKKSVTSLHKSAEDAGYHPVLEISSKSELQIGQDLSAFNLEITTKKYMNKFSVECAFQGSKVFEHGGPYKDLLEKSSIEAKKDTRIKNSGKLVRFSFYGIEFPLEPKTLFYDWLYINALSQNEKLGKRLKEFCAFSDIEFNPSRSINCQAFSAALYVSLEGAGKAQLATDSIDAFQTFAQTAYERVPPSVAVGTQASLL